MTQDKNQVSQKEPLETGTQKLHCNFTEVHILTVWCLTPSLQA